MCVFSSIFVPDLFNKFYLEGTTLVLINAQFEDTSVIRCIATNDYGKLTADVYLDVLGKPLTSDNNMVAFTEFSKVD